MNHLRLPFVLVLALSTACGGTDGADDEPTVVAVDRFSQEAGNKNVRDGTQGLPGPNEPIDFDQPMFWTEGLGPAGEPISYYEFDIQRSIPSSMYVFTRDGVPLEGQGSIIDLIPGDDGYTDFWRIVEVSAPADYEVDSIRSLAALEQAGFPTNETNRVLNAPVVPKGSTARMRVGGGSAELQSAWYRDQIAYHFTFEEAPIELTEFDTVPVAYVFVAFNINPDQPGGGSDSGFLTEVDSGRTHNVLEFLPGDPGYSPLWMVQVYDNAEFDNVTDEPSARAATRFPGGTDLVNCPLRSAAP